MFDCTEHYLSMKQAIINVSFLGYHVIFSRELPDHSVEMINKFLASVIECEKSKGNRACRGPFLAQLELEKLCRQECIYSDIRQSKLFLCYKKNYTFL